MGFYLIIDSFSLKTLPPIIAFIIYNPAENELMSIEISDS